MSEPVTPLAGAVFDGAVRVEEQPRRGMITLRGPHADPAFAEAVRGVCDLSVPATGTFTAEGDHLLTWMSPDELMLMLPPARVAEALLRLASDLSGQHHMAVEVTDARALFRVSGDGPAVRDALAKLAPVDFSADAFGPGRFRRTRLAQVPAALWCEADGSFGVMCFRSVAHYAFTALTVAAAKDARVGFY